MSKYTFSKIKSKYYCQLMGTFSRGGGMLCCVRLAFAGTCLHSIIKQCVWILKCVERKTCISGWNLAYKLV